MDAEPSMLLVGHSFIRRLADYALVSGTMNLGLNEGDCQVSFFARGGLTLRKLMPLTDEVLSRQPDVVFLEIGCNEVDRVAPFVLAHQVFQYAKMLVTRDVRRVIVSQIFFRVSARSRHHVVSEFNDRVTQYNQRMRQLTTASTAVDFWRHRGGMWASWRQLLCDGIHYTDDGHRRYYSSVRGALIAASNRLRVPVTRSTC